MLNRDISSATDTYGILFLLGAFGTEKEAKAHLEEVVEKTGHEYLMIAQYGKAVPLQRKYENVKPLYVENGKIKAM